MPSSHSNLEGNTSETSGFDEEIERSRDFPDRQADSPRNSLEVMKGESCESSPGRISDFVKARFDPGRQQGLYDADRLPGHVFLSKLARMVVAEFDVSEDVVLALQNSAGKMSGREVPPCLQP